MPAQIHQCDAGSSSDDLQLTDVTISPLGGKVTRGSNITVTATGDDIASYAISQGSNLKLSVKYGIITVLSKTYDLCQLLSESGYISCPIDPQSGSKTVTVSEEIPSDAPTGAYSGSASATDQEGHEIFSIEFSMSVVA